MVRILVLSPRRIIVRDAILKAEYPASLVTTFRSTGAGYRDGAIDGRVTSSLDGSEGVACHCSGYGVSLSVSRTVSVDGMAVPSAIRAVPVKNA
ncbi:MAG: hypothetical protein ACLR0U_14755 [Enterocloster clostridioformis]